MIEKTEYFEDFNVDINWLYICIQLSYIYIYIYIYNWTTNQSFVVIFFLSSLIFPSLCNKSWIWHDNLLEKVFVCDNLGGVWSVEYASHLYVYVVNLNFKIDKFILIKGTKLNLNPYPPWQINCWNFSMHICLFFFFYKICFYWPNLILKCGVKLGRLALGLLKVKIHHRFKLLWVVSLGLH